MDGGSQPGEQREAGRRRSGGVVGARHANTPRVDADFSLRERRGKGDLSYVFSSRKDRGKGREKSRGKRYFPTLFPAPFPSLLRDIFTPGNSAPALGSLVLFLAAVLALMYNSAINNLFR